MLSKLKNLLFKVEEDKVINRLNPPEQRNNIIVKTTKKNNKTKKSYRYLEELSVLIASDIRKNYQENSRVDSIFNGYGCRKIYTMASIGIFDDKVNSIKNKDLLEYAVFNMLQIKNEEDLNNWEKEIEDGYGSFSNTPLYDLHRSESYRAIYLSDIENDYGFVYEGIESISLQNKLDDFLCLLLILYPSNNNYIEDLLSSLKGVNYKLKRANVFLEILIEPYINTIESLSEVYLEEKLIEVKEKIDKEYKELMGEITNKYIPYVKKLEKEISETEDDLTTIYLDDLEEENSIQKERMRMLTSKYLNTAEDNRKILYKKEYSDSEKTTIISNI